MFDISNFFQIVVSGCAIGSVYALLALGYTITYNSLRLINFAQGDMYMLGAVFGLMYVNSGVPYIAAIFLGGLTSAVFGMIIERGIFRPLRGFAPLNLIIATIGISTTIRAVSQLIWGSHAMPYPPVFGTNPIAIGPVQIMPAYLAVLCIAALCIVLLQLFFQYTKLGKAIRATSQNRDAAAMMGIPIDRMGSIAAAISAGLGGIGGVLVGPIFYVEMEMGALAGLKGFAAAVLGGFGSIPGAISGGVVLGIAENLSARYISSAYKDAIAFVVLIAVLLLKPNGLLGGKGKGIKKI